MISRTEPTAGAGGFTLLEMIIVLVVLGLVAGIVVSRGPMRSPTVEVRSVATSLLQAMRAARAQAIATDQETPFSLDVLHHAYVIGTGVPHPMPASVTVQMTIGGKPARAIGFLPDGSSTGGDVLLADASKHMAVTVDWLSGRMRVRDVEPP
jgi:general secretion pathway protein H